MKWYKKIEYYYKKLVNFILKDIWHLDLSQFSKAKARFINYLQVLILTTKDFLSQRISFKASALSYFSALSVVPFFAIMFIITKGFGAAERLESLLYNYFEGSEELLGHLLSSASNIVEAGRSGLFGTISLLFLSSIIIWLMLNVEKAFNEIWKVDNKRRFSQRALYYIALLLLTPFVVIIFMTFALIYTDALNSIGVHLNNYIPITSLFTWITAYAFVVGVLTVMYKFIPNTKVKLGAAFNSALVLAFAFIFVQYLYLETQLMVTGVNAVYGVFAAIPLFMIWMNISWNLILFGVELSYAYQNVDSYRFL